MTDKINLIIEDLKKLTLVEAATLVKEIEKAFGVDTSISTINSTAAVSTIAAPVAAQIEEKTAFDVVLEEVPQDKKIAILKIVRQATGLGLKESKDIVDSIPKIVKAALSKEDAEQLKKELESVGGKASVK